MPLGGYRGGYISR